MISKQRRAFVRNSLLGTGAALSFALPCGRGALNARTNFDSDSELRSMLARAESSAAHQSWRPLDQCVNDSCAAASRVRIVIDSLNFPQTFRALRIDAMFATVAGIKAFRIASFQPGAVSPASKPFAFEVDVTGVVGFRSEHAGANPGEISVTGSALLNQERTVLSPGRYLLALSTSAEPIDPSRLAVAVDPGWPIAHHDGTSPGFAYVAFSVNRVESTGVEESTVVES